MHSFLLRFRLPHRARLGSGCLVVALAACTSERSFFGDDDGNGGASQSNGGGSSTGSSNDGGGTGAGDVDGGPPGTGGEDDGSGGDGNGGSGNGNGGSGNGSGGTASGGSNDGGDGGDSAGTGGDGGSSGEGGTGGAGGNSGGGMGGMGGGSGNGGAGGTPECTSNDQCAWSDCVNGACSRAIKISGSQSGMRCVLRDSGDVACWNAPGYAVGAGEASPFAAITEPTLVRGVGGTGLLSDAVDIAVGSTVFCALRRNGDVVCWGQTGAGLGRGSVASTGVLEAVGPVVSTSGTGTLTNVVRLGNTVQDSFCAVRRSEDAACWGGNPNGSLGHGSTNATGVPTLMVGVGGTGVLSPLLDAQAGFHSCALATSGDVYCAGSTQYSIVPASTTTPVAIAGVSGTGTLDDATSMSVGNATCVVLESKQVACWGDNTFGQLGRGAAGPSGSGSGSWTATPELVRNPADPTVPLANVERVASGNSHVCALDEDGHVYCWGSNGSYQIGQGTAGADEYDLPQQVPGVDGTGVLSNVQSIAVGLGFSCAIREPGDVVCWGLVREVFDPNYEVIRSGFPSVIPKPVAPE